MDISAIGGISDSTPNAIGANAMGKEDFLNLLLQQLSHQDPLNPMDSTEFTVQLAQFSSLEELSNINSTLNDVLSFQESMQNASVAELIGKTVRVEGNTSYLTDRAEFNYELAGDASSVEISIYDTTGRLVRTEDIASQGAGAQRYVWDGKDNNGNPMSEGYYTFEVNAKDLSGTPVPVLSTASGTVEEVVYENGLTFILLNNGTKINLNDIKSIGERRLHDA